VRVRKSRRSLSKSRRSRSPITPFLRKRNLRKKVMMM
jgi:hypothetical protein